MGRVHTMINEYALTVFLSQTVFIAVAPVAGAVIAFVMLTITLKIMRDEIIP
jgi:hypothetical protein